MSDERVTQSRVHRGHLLTHRAVNIRHPDTVRSGGGAWLEGGGDGSAGSVGSIGSGVEPEVCCPVLDAEELMEDGDAWSAAVASFTLSEKYDHDGNYVETAVANVLASADMGSVHGYINTPWTDTTYPCTVGTGRFHSAAHVGRFVEWVVPSDPSERRAAGAFVTFRLNNYESFAYGKAVGFGVSASEPVGLDDCDVVGLVVLPGEAGPVEYTVFVPAAFLPAASSSVWVGIIPASRAPVGMWECNPAIPSWPESTGQYDSWGTDLSVTGATWALWSDDVAGDGHRFVGWPAGVGDGDTVEFTGLPTVEGSAVWTINGVVTVPLAYDDTTGEVEFHIPPGFRARVLQSGVFG